MVIIDIIVVSLAAGEVYEEPRPDTPVPPSSQHIWSCLAGGPVLMSLCVSGAVLPGKGVCV